MCAGFLFRREQAGALHHDIDAQRAPRQCRRIALREHLDAVAVDDHRVALDLYLAGKLAVRRVITRKVRIRFRTAEVVDRDDRKVVLLAAFVMRAQNVAADAAVAIDRDFDGHSITP